MALIHTCYRITDIDRSVAFYEALGFQEVGRLPIKDEAINVFMNQPGDGDMPVEIDDCLSAGALQFTFATAGDFVVTWTSMYQDGSLGGIYAQRYNAAGVAQGAEFRANTFTTNFQTESAVAMDASGDTRSTWTSTPEARSRSLTPRK